MLPRQLKPGDVVQINPKTIQREGFFGGCFMMVTEPKSWGAQGFIAVPGERGTVPAEAYFRCKFEDMEFVGHATWVPENLAEAADIVDEGEPKKGYVRWKPFTLPENPYSDASDETEDQ